MRVLIISHNYPHQDDPACGIFAVRQFLEMGKLGCRSTVLVPGAYAPDFVSRLERYKLFRPRRLIQYDGLESIPFRFLRPPGRYFLLWDGFSAFHTIKKRIHEIHMKDPFDIIYARGFWLEADIGIRLSKFLNLPVVGVAMGSDVNVTPTLGRSFNRHFINIANRLNATMSTGYGPAKKIDAVSGRKTLVMGGVVDIEEFAPVADRNAPRRELNLAEDRFIILFAGHVIRSKGIYELVNAFNILSRNYPDSILVICGRGEDSKNVRQNMNMSGLSDKIKFVGNINPSQMHKWMQASDLFVLPSYFEGMPNSVMEAMACGLPVITTAVGGLPDAVGDCEGVILVQPRQVDELCEAVLKVINDKELRHQMGVASRKRAEAMFNIKKNTDTVVKCMRQTIDEYRTGTGRL